MRIELEIDDALMRRIAQRTRADVFWSDPALQRLILTHLVHLGFEAKLAAERVGSMAVAEPNAPMA